MVVRRMFLLGLALIFGIIIFYCVIGMGDIMTIASSMSNHIKKHVGSNSNQNVEKVMKDEADIANDRSPANTTNDKYAEDKQNLGDWNPDKIYHDNKFYNSDGFMKDKSDHDKQKDDQTQMINKAEKSDAIPKTVTYITPLIDRSQITHRVFINCGGTFPWSVELFTRTYPDANKFLIHSFILDRSYKVMYNKFPNHQIHIGICANESSKEHFDTESFGVGFEVTQEIQRIDIAQWLLKNTKADDNVVLRVDSKEEKEIVERLVETKAIDDVDKYYTTSNDSDTLKYLIRQLNQRQNISVNTWDRDGLTYSDIASINKKKTPEMGKIKNMCSNESVRQKFALLLYSKESSANAFKVFNLLREFSPKDKLPLTVFLPFSFFEANWTDTWKIFETFHVGLRFGCEHVNIEDKVCSKQNIEYKLRNQAIAVQNIFETHEFILQNVLIDQNMDDSVMKNVMKECNYSFYCEGIDITHLIPKILNGSTITMDDTGQKGGEYLMINMDMENAEYLALYMVQRFMPWLLKLSECN